jgi:hypothetical protein
MEQALTTTGNNLPANVNEPFESGLEALDRGDVIIPRLTITQPTTPDIDAVNVGKFSVNITGDFYESMHLVCLKLSKGRILWPKDYSKDNDPLCKSNDFLTPVLIEGQSPMCHTCAVTPGTKDDHECKYANWGVDKKGKVIAPLCMEVWNMLVFDLETYMPMFLSLKSTSIKPLKKLFSAISILGNAKKIPLWGWSFGASLKMENYEKGKAYVPVFTSPTQVGQEEYSVLSEVRSQLANIDLYTEDKPDAPPASTQPAEAEQF